MIDYSNTDTGLRFENFFKHEQSGIYYLVNSLIDNPNIKAGFILQDTVKDINKPCSILSKRFGKAVYLHQTHSDIAVNLSGNKKEPKIERFEGDALITGEKNIAISVHTADCLPVLIYHPGGFIAAVHAGWRGTLQKIALKTSTEMEINFEIHTKDLKFILMPAIRGCCYEVGAEVAVFFENRGYNDKGELYIDVTLENITQLREFGIPEENIIVVHMCTNCFKGFDFPSFRKDGRLIRRSVNFIACQS